MTKLSDLGEFELIAHLRARLGKPGRGVVVGIGDDTAVLKSPRDQWLLFTTDTLVEQVHFRLDWTTPKDLGWKAMAQNVSDIAAMGGTPRYATISLAAADDQQVATVERLYAGLAECARAYQVDIVGGDTVRSPGPMVITVALMGQVKREHLVTRSGAQAGDAILVTHELGAAAVGLLLLEHGNNPPAELANAVKAQHRPVPRLEEARVLAKSGLVSSMIDLSDGLGSDLRRICEESRVGARVEWERVPVSPLVERSLAHLRIERSPIELAITGGEDFALLLTTQPGNIERLQALLAYTLPTCLTVIGSITSEQEGVMAVKKDGTAQPLAKGYTHFRREKVQP